MLLALLISHVLATPLAEPSPSHIEDWKALKVLSYNVAGLPSIISSGNPSQNTKAIGRLLKPYNIVNVQEDFNYHADLYSTDTHVYRSPTSGGVPFGSGLNLMSDYPFSEYEQVKWKDCTVSQGNCLTPKGFTFTRSEIESGVYVDVYNVHTGAGSTEDEMTKRRLNLEQLMGFIKSFSEGNAVLVFGDTNTRYTRSGDNIKEFVQGLGLTDTFVQLALGGVVPVKGAPAVVCDAALNNFKTCEVVDKIMYRGSKTVLLEAVEHALEVDRFKNATGAQLSDHYALAATLRWKRNEEFLTSILVGGPHGTPFNDVTALNARAKLAFVGLRSAKRIDQVVFGVAGGPQLKHGGNGGTYKQLDLQAGEFIQSVRIATVQKDGRTRVGFLEFQTNFGRSLKGGEGSNDMQTISAPNGYQVAGMNGRAGTELDKLGFLFTKL